MTGQQALTELLEHARRAGARGCELLRTYSTGSIVQVDHGKLVRRDPVSSSSLLVRVWLEGGRSGELSGAPDAAVELIDRALKNAGSAPEDPLAGPVGRLTASAQGLGIDDRRWAQVAMEDRVDVILAAERGARGVDRRVLTEDFAYADQRVRREFANSKGVVAEEWSTAYRAEGTVRVREGGDELMMSDVIQGRSFASTASLPFGTNLAKRAVALLGPAEAVRGAVRVMMPPRVTGQLFGALAEGFRVDRLEAEQSVFANAPAGERFVDTRIHLVDDGQAPGGLRTHAFDDRGVASVPLTLLREGVVANRLLDPHSARRLETRPTGHVFGGALRPSNLQLRSGTRSMHAILAELGALVFVLDHVENLDGLDLASGELTCVASGHMRKGSETLGPVRRVQLRGNVIDVLNEVVEVASDTDRVAHVDAPGVLVDGFVVG